MSYTCTICVCVFIALHSFITCVALQNPHSNQETQLNHHHKTPLSDPFTATTLLSPPPPPLASGHTILFLHVYNYVILQLLHKWNYAFCIFSEIGFLHSA